MADHLTLSDIRRVDLDHLGALNSIALMSPGLAHGSNPIDNVYATLGAGDTVNVGDVSQGLLWRTLRETHLKTALIGDADGDDTGKYRPASLIIPTPDFILKNPVTVLDPQFPGGRRTDPKLCRQTTNAALAQCDLVIVHWGDFSRIEREARQGDFLPDAYRQHRERALGALQTYFSDIIRDNEKRFEKQGEFTILLVVPTGPLTSADTWERLTPVIQINGQDRSCTLSSDTTQNDGLVATRDVAPTILTDLKVPIPTTMTGAPFKEESLGPGRKHLVRLDRMTYLNQVIQTPIFWTIGLVGGIYTCASLAFYMLGVYKNRPWLCRSAQYGIRLVASWPFALLLIPLLHIVSPSQYMTQIGLLTVLLALIPSPSVILSAMAIVLVLDGFIGTPLVSQSALSAYMLSGIRFYGIGNEYMGFLLGGALLLPTLFRSPPIPLPRTGEGIRSRYSGFPQNWGRRGRSGAAFPIIGAEGRSDSVALLLWFMLVIFVLSFPAFGAKAGGAITATAAFTLAFTKLRGKRITWQLVLLSSLAGVALVFIWAFVGSHYGVRKTHIATAVTALTGGRFGYILGVTLRKIGLAIHVTLHPGTLLGLTGFFVVGIVFRRLLWRQVSEYLANSPRFASVFEAGLWACLVSVLCNDSGIVAAVLLLSCLVLPLLHGLYQESCASLPLTSEMSESVSPSVIP